LKVALNTIHLYCTYLLLSVYFTHIIKNDFPGFGFHCYSTMYDLDVLVYSDQENGWAIV
jgi:hypothetical protein